MRTWENGVIDARKVFARPRLLDGRSARPFATRTTTFAAMNALLSCCCLLLTCLAGCHAAPEPAPAPGSVDPFLGHWRADTKRLVRFAATGHITHDTTVAHRQEFDFAPATYIKLDYTRTGEEIGFRLGPAGPGPGNYDPMPMRRYVRALTPNGFTLETVHGFSFGPTPQRGDSFVDYHRSFSPASRGGSRQFKKTVVILCISLLKQLGALAGYFQLFVSGDDQNSYA